MTAHKAQGQTLSKVVVDLVGCFSTARSSSLDGLIILDDFDLSQITKRRSEDHRKEFARLVELRVKTSMKFMIEGEVDEVGRMAGPSQGVLDRRNE